MHRELIRSKLFEQEPVYQAIKAGDVASVQYSGYRDKEWGINDANYLNRMCMAYYLLYAEIDDEDLVAYLFGEELKDRKTNSFQGIGNTLNVLTVLLRKYNADGKYDLLFDEAKNANFDCACGYDRTVQMDSDIKSLTLLEGIYLSQDLCYKDVMEQLVGKWKDGISEWNHSNRAMLIRFNSFLGKEQENEEIYKILLEEAMAAGKAFNIVSTYNDVIQYYIGSRQFEIAETHFCKMIETVDFSDVERFRLFGDVLEECCDLIDNDVKSAANIWKWAKPHLKKKTTMYGNLYTKAISAAEKMGDPYRSQLEDEYLAWKEKVKIK